MNDPALLIGLFTVFFIASCIHISRKSLLFGGFYCFLFIYTIFAQIGYVLLPHLSRMINAYFGPEIFFIYFHFVALSFLSFYVMFLMFYKAVPSEDGYSLVHSAVRFKPLLFHSLMAAHLIGMLVVYIQKYEDMNYMTMALGEFPYFTVAYKYLALRCLLLYALLRIRPALPVYTSRIADQIQLVAGLVLFISISIHVGDRTDILSLALGIAYLEILLKPRRDIVSLKTIFVGAFLIVVVYGLHAIETLRGGFQMNELIERFVFQDYYSPSHILFGAIAMNYIHPLEVLRSNAANSLMGVGVPYLQTEIGNILTPGSSSRSTGYAFYIFTEGYMAFGNFGFLYNGIVVYWGLSLWRKLTLSDDPSYNKIMMALLAMQMANIVRGQSSYFIKDIYLVFIPALFMIFLATGLRPRLWTSNRRLHTRRMKVKSIAGGSPAI